MTKKVLFLSSVLMMLCQIAGAQEMLLTLESDESAYPWNGDAAFKATLKNLSEEEFFTQYKPITYRITVKRYGFVVWEWSKEKGCG
jgi:hypothetical protein